MKIISENHDKENGIWKPTIAFNLPQNLTQYTFTISEDMIRASGVCPLVFVKELEKCFCGDLSTKGVENE